MLGQALSSIARTSNAKHHRADDAAAQRNDLHRRRSVARRKSSRAEADLNNFFSEHWNELEHHRATEDSTFLKTAWANYDNDGSGSLEIDEVEQLCLDYMNAIPELIEIRSKEKNHVKWDLKVHQVAINTARKVFELCDVDNSGEIDFEEFSKTFYRIVGRSIELRTGDALESGHLLDRNEKDHEEDEDLLDATQNGMFRSISNCELKAAKRLSGLLQSYGTTDLGERISPMLREIMSKQPMERSPQEVETIVCLIQQIGLWSKIDLSRETLRYAARHLQFASSEAETVLCRQNEPVKNMFVILSGSALCIIKDSAEVMHKITVLHIGDTVGEGEMLKGINYEGKVTTREFCEFAKLDDRIFTQILRPYHVRYLKKKLRLLSTIPMLSLTPDDVLVELALHSRYKTVSSNTIILQQGTITHKSDPVFFVVEGEVRIVKEIPTEKPKSVINNTLSDECTGQKVVYTPKSIFIEVSRMGPRNLFGELGYFSTSKKRNRLQGCRQASVISTTRTVILIMDRLNFMDAVSFNKSTVQEATKTRMVKSQDYMSWLRFGKNWRNYKVMLRNLLQNPSLSARRGDILPVFEKSLIKKQPSQSKKTPRLAAVLPSI